MELLFLTLSLWAYLVATACFVTHLMIVRDAPRRLALAALVAAFALHSVALAARTSAVGLGAISSVHDQLSVLGWLTVGVYLLLQLRYQLAVLGALVSPLAFLVTLSAYMVHAGVRALPMDLKTTWLAIHIGPAILGYATFAIAFCISLAYLFQEHQLKGKRRGGMIRRLPSLQTLDELNFRFVAWGFALFTVGIITGSMLAKMKWGEFWSWEPVQVLSVLAWLLYATLLHTRSVGWRGRKAATLTIVGFALLVASFVGVNLIFPGRHAGIFS